MTQKHLNLLWATVGPVLLYWSLNTWIVMQDGLPVLDVGLLRDDRVGAHVVALDVCPVLLLLTASIALAHALASHSPRISARLPVVGFDDLDHAKTSARLYQGFFVLAFLVLPTAALVHFAWQLHDLAVVPMDKAGQPPVGYAVREAFLCTLPWENCDLPGDTFRIGLRAPPAEIAAKGAGVTWYPFGTLAWFALVSATAMVQMARLARAVLR